MIFNKERVEDAFNKYSDDIFRFAYSRLHDRGKALDVVSDTFYTFIQLSNNLESEGKLKSFLFGIAFNKIKQQWNIQKDIPYNDDLDYEIIENKSNKRSKLFNKLIKLIEKLPERYKKVINLRYLEHKSIDTVSKELKLSKTNITTIQNRAVNKLRKLVNEE